MRTLLLGTCIIGASLFAACSPPAATDAQWSLMPDQSGMTYVTVKNNLLGEINTFRNISGNVNANGDAIINIDLKSVDTNNEIRDGRMKEFLFKTEVHPAAKITTKIDLQSYAPLPIGQSRTELLALSIDLHGVVLDYDAYVLVTRLGENKVNVATKAPLLLEASDFNLEEGLAKLQTLAGLDSITPVVPVTVSFVFER